VTENKKKERERVNKKKGGLDRLRILELIEEAFAEPRMGRGLCKIMQIPMALSPVILESINAQHTQ